MQSNDRLESTLPTMGVEWEFQLLDAKTFDLADMIDPLMEKIGDDSCIGPESFQSCVEIRTEPFRKIRDIRQQLKDKITLTQKACEDLDISLCSLGSHPFTRKPGTSTQSDRYLKFEREYPFITNHHLVFSAHVHIGMDSLDDSLLVMNRLKTLQPLLVALSANCPYWEGEETGFVSFRQYLVRGGLNAGIPPRMETTEEFNQFIETLTNAGFLTGLKDLHWDIRPRPDLGTIEIRILDAPPTLDEIISLSSLVRSLACALLSPHLPYPLSVTETTPEWAHKENLFQAYHLGMNAYFVFSETDYMPLRKLGEEILDALMPQARRQGEEAELSALQVKLAEQPHYEKFRSLRAQGKSFPEILAKYSKELSASLN